MCGPRRPAPRQHPSLWEEAGHTPPLFFRKELAQNHLQAGRGLSGQTWGSSASDTPRKSGVGAMWATPTGWPLTAGSAFQKQHLGPFPGGQPYPPGPASVVPPVISPGPVCWGCSLNTPHSLRSCRPQKWTRGLTEPDQGAGRAESTQRPQEGVCPLCFLILRLMAASFFQPPSPASPASPLCSQAPSAPLEDPVMPRAPALQPHSGPSLTSPPVRQCSPVRLQG